MDFERLVRRHKDAVYRQMVRVCGNYDDAEDVLVQALLSAYKALPDLKDEGAFQGWLAVIGRRVCGRIKKREALKPVLSLSGFGDEDLEAPAPDPGVDTMTEQQELSRCVKAAIADLPEKLRQVYVMREIQGQSAEATAKSLGIGIAATKSRLHRARDQVRQHLDSSICAA